MRKWVGALYLSALCCSQLNAAPRTEAALSLLEAPTARPAALGEALTAAVDDVAAFSYNPSALATLEQNHATFLYHRGVNDDAFGQFLFGRPLSNKNALGLSVGYYDGGSIEIADGATTRTITAQRDLVLGLGTARRFGSFTAGVTGKYFSSQLAESDKAVAYAADAGIGFPINSRVHAGIAVQNIGTQLKYSGIGNDLPRIARAGLAMALPFQSRTLLLLDAPYHMNQSEFFPAVGLETGVGPLTLRAGYKKVTDDNQFSLGAGFRIGQTELSYAFDLANRLNSRHRVSVGVRFGDKPDFVAEEAPGKEPAIIFPEGSTGPWWKSDQPDELR